MGTRLWAFIRLSRPHFLVGGALMYALGAATTGSVDAAGYLWGQLLVTSAQITAHYVNEYADLEPDRRVEHRTVFSGGSGVLVDGTLAPSVALHAAWVSSTLAIVAALVLLGRSPAVTLVGLTALAVSWGYSVPPIRLLDRGWGELATSVVVAGIVPSIAPLSEHMLTAELWWSIAILIPVHVAMMLAFELPDLDSDSAAGKRVLAVRIGRSRAERLIVGSTAIGGAVGTIGVAVGGLPTTASFSALALFPAVVMIASMTRSRDDVLTTSAVATFVVAGAGLLAGLSA